MDRAAPVLYNYPAVTRPGKSLRSQLRGCAPLVAASCVALLLPAAAGARIVPQKGIMGINLNMTRADVVRAEGRPDAERIVSSEIIGRQRLMRFGKTQIFFGGIDRRARVVTVRTRDRTERTRSGVGVGSSEAAVRSAITGARCRTEFGFRHCWKGRFRPGERVTDFEISLPERRVTQVTIAFVID